MSFGKQVKMWVKETMWQPCGGCGGASTHFPFRCRICRSIIPLHAGGPTTTTHADSKFRRCGGWGSLRCRDLSVCDLYHVGSVVYMHNIFIIFIKSNSILYFKNRKMYYTKHYHVVLIHYTLLIIYIHILVYKQIYTKNDENKRCE